VAGEKRTQEDVTSIVSEQVLLGCGRAEHEMHAPLVVPGDGVRVDSQGLYWVGEAAASAMHAIRPFDDFETSQGAQFGQVKPVIPVVDTHVSSLRTAPTSPQTRERQSPAAAQPLAWRLHFCSRRCILKRLLRRGPPRKYGVNTMIEPRNPAEEFFIAGRRLAPREFEVIQLRAEEGLTRHEIADRLGVRPGTVDKYFDTALNKLDCQSQRELTRRYLDARYRVAVHSLDPSKGPSIQAFAAQRPDEVEDVVGEAVVLYHSPGLKGLPPDRVPDFLVHDEPWPFPPEVSRVADTPNSESEAGDDGAKWALCDYKEPISDIRDLLELHVRPFRYFWARRTNDRLDERRMRGATLRRLFWERILPLEDSPLGNLLVAHVVLTVSDEDRDYVLFTRRRDNPDIVAYERGAWSASFEEQCRGDPKLAPGTALKPADRSVMTTASRGLREEMGVEAFQDEWLLSLILEWANGYTGAIIRIHLDLKRHPELKDLLDVENAWRFKHEDREADAVRLVPFTKDILIPLVFEGRDPDGWLPPSPGQTFTRLHRTTPVRILHALIQANKIGVEDLRRIDRSLRRFRPD